MELSLFWCNPLYGGILLFTGWLLDLIFGDPVYPFHPIRLLGTLLIRVEAILFKMGLQTIFGGILLGLILMVASLGWWGCIHWFLNIVLPSSLPDFPGPLAMVWDLYMVWSLMALGDLLAHGRRIRMAVRRGDLPAARSAAGMLVGRDQDRMGLDDCCRAGVESLSENLADGVIATMFWYLLGGIPGMVVWKVISTMDSMVGYRNERYLLFGRFGARADDAACWVPARLTWLLLVAASILVPGANARGAWKSGTAWHHVFPGFNSGWPEAGAAGALGLRLAGPIWKNGIMVSADFVGPPEGRTTCTGEDLGRMMILDQVATLLFLVVSLGVMATFGTAAGFFFPG